MIIIFCRIEAAKKINKSHNEQAIEDEMRDVMRHAPNRPGGLKYKVIKKSLYSLFALTPLKRDTF